MHVYEGDQWPRESKGTSIALICDVGSNLIHRKRLTQVDSLWFRGERIDPESEFIRSTDTWFRPVQLGGGPDGALYIADMYREVIEHPKSLPPTIKSQVDLNSGNHRGRIWRVVSENRPLRRKLDASLDGGDAQELIGLLGHANQWHRRTAARLLMQERDHTPENVSLLREAATKESQPLRNIEALNVLGTIPEGLDKDTRDRALLIQDRSVRWHALRLAIEHIDRLGGLSPEWLMRGRHDRETTDKVDFLLFYGSPALLPLPVPRYHFLTRWTTTHPLKLKDPWMRWAIEGAITPDMLLRASGDLDTPLLEFTVSATVLSGDPELNQRLVRQIGTSELSIRERALNQLVKAVESLPPKASRPELKQWILDVELPRFRTRLSGGKVSAEEYPGLRLIGWALGERSGGLLKELLSPESESIRATTCDRSTEFKREINEPGAGRETPANDTASSATCLAIPPQDDERNQRDRCRSRIQDVPRL